MKDLSSLILDILLAPIQAPHLAIDIKEFQFFTGSLLHRLPLLFHLHQEIVLGLDVPAQLFCLLQQLVAPLRKQQHQSEALLKTIPFSLIAYATDSAFIWTLKEAKLANFCVTL